MLLTTWRTQTLICINKGSVNPTLTTNLFKDSIPKGKLVNLKKKKKAKKWARMFPKLNYHNEILGLLLFMPEDF